MKVSEYIDTVNTRFKKGKIKEKFYREDLEKLLNTLLPNTSITINPNSIKYGGPNLTVSQNGLPIGFIKTTDLGTDLNQLDGIEAVRRHKSSLSNLITTNYIDFQWFKNGSLIASFSIGKLN
jgi:hypothetical protein